MSLKLNIKLLSGILVLVAALLVLFASSPTGQANNKRDEILQALHDYFNNQNANQDDVQQVVDDYYDAINNGGNVLRNGNNPVQGQATGLTATRATVNSGGHSLTVYLSETNLKGTLDPADWSYAVGGTSRSLSSGTLDAASGQIEFTGLAPRVTRTQTVTVSYTQDTANLIQNQADESLGTFSGLATTNNVWTSLACTKGPGPDPLNPNSPCGTGPAGHGSNPQPSNYKPISLLTDAEMANPQDPGPVTLTCATKPSCTIGWQTAPNATLWHVYLWAKLEQDSGSDTVCTTKRILAREASLHKNTLSYDVQITSPSSLPTGCQVKEWMATVATYTYDGRSSAAALSPTVTP